MLRLWRALSVLAVVTFVVHGAALRAPFQYDDRHAIVDNPAIRDPGNLSAFFVDPGLFSGLPDRAMYRPVVLVSYLVDHRLGGGGPAIYHLTNLVLHTLAAWSLYLLIAHLRSSTGAAGTRAALVGALVYAIHPLTVEPAVYVSARAESLALAVSLGSVLQWRRGRRGIGAALYGVALLAKSTAIVLPAVAWCLERAAPASPDPELGDDGPRARRSPHLYRRVRPWAGYLLVAGAYLLVTAGLLRRSLGTERVRGAWHQVLTQLEAGAYLVRLVAVPHPLSVEHPLGGVVIPGVVHALAAAAAVSAVWACRRLLPTRTWWWIAAALLPLVPVWVIPLNAVLSEHRLAFTVALAVAALACDPPRTWARRPVRRTTWVGLLLLAGLSLARGQDWQSEERLWQGAVHVAPDNYRAHFFLADVYRRQGRPRQALQAYARADTLSGGLLEVRLSRAAQLLSLGRRHEARALIEPMAHSHPHRAAVLYNLALALKHEDPDRAEALLSQAWRLQPELRQAAMELALLQEERGALEEAGGVLQQALDRTPDWTAGWVNLGFIRIRERDVGGARRAWERALALEPNQAVARRNLRRLEALETQRGR